MANCRLHQHQRPSLLDFCPNAIWMRELGSHSNFGEAIVRNNMECIFKECSTKFLSHLHSTQLPFLFSRSIINIAQSYTFQSEKNSLKYSNSSGHYLQDRGPLRISKHSSRIIINHIHLQEFMGIMLYSLITLNTFFMMHGWNNHII